MLLSVEMKVADAPTSLHGFNAPGAGLPRSRHNTQIRRLQHGGITEKLVPPINCKQGSLGHDGWVFTETHPHDSIMLFE